MRTTGDRTSGCLVRSVGLDRKANVPHIFQSFLAFSSLDNAMITIYYFGVIFSLWMQIKASSHIWSLPLQFNLCLKITTHWARSPQTERMDHQLMQASLRFHKCFMTFYSAYCSINRMVIIMNVTEWWNVYITRQNWQKIIQIYSKLHTIIKIKYQMVFFCTNKNIFSVLYVTIKIIVIENELAYWLLPPSPLMQDKLLQEGIWLIFKYRMTEESSN